MKRKRKYIPMIEIAASALADKLSVAERDALRELKVSAQYIRRMFTPDHIKLHSWGGADKWWNLDMRLRDDISLQIKNAEDTSRTAKAKRIDEKWGAFTRAMAAGKKPPKRKSKWPSRPRSPWPKRTRGKQP